MSVTESDVYNCLSFHRGKSPFEIRDELRDKKGKKDPLKEKSALKTGLALVVDIPMSGIYLHLGSLERHGFAKANYRNIPPERLAARRGNREREYFLTSSGIQNKTKYEKPDDPDLESQLAHM